MKPENELALYINAKLIKTGIQITVDKKEYSILYPINIWNKISPKVRQFLLENIAYAETQILPLMLNKTELIYNTPYPFFESMLYRNQLYDMLYCEQIDGVVPYTYLRSFYNTNIKFVSNDSAIPSARVEKKNKGPIAVLPFSFGKESLASVGICKELNIDPFLVYCQEPSQPHEEVLKRKRLDQFERQFGIRYGYIHHEPGLFRYGKAFQIPMTDLGWGTQTTLLMLLSVPFIYAEGAEYLFFGSEHSNNDMEMINGWKVFCSYDQTSFWTPQQNMVMRMITAGFSSVHCLFEPLEEITVFYLLHHRYPEFASYQFSCHALDTLVGESAWCHNCSKCFKNYLFALATGADTEAIGFIYSMLSDKAITKYYLSLKQNDELDLDYALSIILRKNPESISASMRKLIKKRLRPWSFYQEHFLNLKYGSNLPPLYKKDLSSIYQSELDNFKQNL